MFEQKEKYMWKRIWGILAIFLFLFLIPGCTDDIVENIQIEEEEVDVIFSLKTPSNPSTYAISESDENYIKEIDVLIFKEENGIELYAYSQPAIDLVASGRTLEFKVALKKDEANKYRFVILPNARTYVNALGNIIKGTGKERVLSQLQSVLSDQWNATSSADFTPLPMWGESDTTYTISEDTRLNSIPVLRSLARVDFLSNTLPINKFEIKELYVYNWKKRGRITPVQTVDVWDKNNNIVLLPSLPSLYEESNSDTPLKYTTDNNGFEYEIYLHEAAAPEDADPLKATALVVGGYYDGSSELSYYRVDFREKDESSQEDIYVYRNILRNHKYVFNIRSVLDEGYNHPDTAFTYKKANLTIEITTWNMGDQSDTDIGGSFKFSVNQSIFNLNSIITSGILTVTCDHTNGWSIDESQTTGNIKLTRTGDNVLIEATGTGGGSFVLKAGNLSKKIIVNYT